MYKKSLYCDILLVYMYLKVSTTHFIIWPYIIW